MSLGKKTRNYPTRNDDKYIMPSILLIFDDRTMLTPKMLAGFFEYEGFIPIHIKEWDALKNRREIEYDSDLPPGCYMFLLNEGRPEIAVRASRNYNDVGNMTNRFELELCFGHELDGYSLATTVSKIIPQIEAWKAINSRRYEPQKHLAKPA